MQRCAKPFHESLDDLVMHIIATNDATLWRPGNKHIMNFRVSIMVRLNEAFLVGVAFRIWQPLLRAPGFIIKILEHGKIIHFVLVLTLLTPKAWI